MIYLDLLQLTYRNRRNIFLTKNDIKKLQQKKFMQLVHYVEQYSPYYKEIIKKNHIDIANCKPEDFPVLTKAELLKHFDQIVTDRKITREKIEKFLEKSKNPEELFLNKYYVIHTSGSSGTISYYVYSPKELLAGASLATRADGINFFQTLAYIAATEGHFAGVTMASITKKLPLLYKKVEIMDINAPFSNILKKLNILQPDIVSGYAFALRKIADAQQDKKINISPRLFLSGGEPLSKEDKEYIQQTFHAPLINVYASSEHLYMGLGRDSFSGMYLMEDNLIFELHPTYTIITNLFNYTLPLIRYQMHDQLAVINDTIRAMPFLKVKETFGRNEKVPIFYNDLGQEDFINPIVLVEFFVKNVRQFQIQILNKHSFIFKVILEPHLSKQQREDTLLKIKQELFPILKEKLMTNVTFSIEEVAHLWADPQTGKFKLII